VGSTTVDVVVQCAIVLVVGGMSDAEGNLFSSSTTAYAAAGKEFPQ